MDEIIYYYFISYVKNNGEFGRDFIETKYKLDSAEAIASLEKELSSDGKLIILNYQLQRKVFSDEQYAESKTRDNQQL